MQLSETIKLYSTKEQETLIQAIMLEYISTVNSLVSDATNGTNINKYTSRNVEANLPSALKNQCIRDAKSIVKKHYKTCHKAVLKNRNLAKKGSTLKITAPSLPILKKPCCYVNNQNFKIKNGCVEFPVMPRKAIFLVLILVSNALLLVIALMAVFSFMAMAVKINIYVGIIVICVKNFKKRNT